MWVALTGTQSTGKTTLLDALVACDDIHATCIQEVARGVIRRGHLLGKRATVTSHALYAATQLELELAYDPSVAPYLLSDRCLIDLLAHARVNQTFGYTDWPDHFVDMLAAAARMSCDRYDLFVYLPIEFAQEEDGVRDSDEEYRAAVGTEIRSLLDEWGLPVLEARGPVATRIAELRAALGFEDALRCESVRGSVRSDPLSPPLGRPLVGARFGREFDDLDCRNVTQDQAAGLRETLDQEKLLIFRNQRLSSSDQIRFTRLFGNPDRAWDNRNRSATHDEVQIITNQYAGGAYHYDRRRRMSTVRYWHTDTSFLLDPTRYTFVLGEEVPARFGVTHFANTGLAFAELPPDLEGVEQREVLHSFEYIFGDLLKKRADSREDDVPDVVHPLVWDPGSGPVLYLSELSMVIITDLPDEDGNRLLTQLNEYCKLPQYRYVHHWEPGDFLVWDNLGLMHKGGFADPAFPRTLKRTTVTMSGCGLPRVSRYATA
jgi:alpha-ketoglutarate-dependent taurine dioxygenase